LHGANFSFYTDGKTVKCAKRTAFLGEFADFFNFQSVLDKHEKDVINMFNNLVKCNSDVKYITICGELIGGSYPHPDVKNDNNAPKVQKGVYYCPDNRFYGFDIIINGNEYLSVKLAEYQFKTNNFLYAKTLFTGTLKECMAHSDEFQTTIPAILGLPEIENNICEGIVIRPEETLFFKDSNRIILKKKNAKFQEKDKIKPEKKPLELPSELEGHLVEINTYVTENRLRNVLSKMEKITDKDFGKILGIFMRDVFEECLKDDKFNDLSKTNRKILSKFVNKEIALLIRKNFLNIINGEF